MSHPTPLEIAIGNELRNESKHRLNKISKFKKYGIILFYSCQMTSIINGPNKILASCSC
jgi:hypothetical protein